ADVRLAGPLPPPEQGLRTPRPYQRGHDHRRHDPPHGSKILPRVTPFSTRSYTEIRLAGPSEGRRACCGRPPAAWALGGRPVAVRQGGEQLVRRGTDGSSRAAGYGTMEAMTNHTAIGPPSSSATSTGRRRDRTPAGASQPPDGDTARPGMISESREACL